jgi:hypothetical protein
VKSLLCLRAEFEAQHICYAFCIAGKERIGLICHDVGWSLWGFYRWFVDLLDAFVLEIWKANRELAGHRGFIYVVRESPSL